MTGDVRVPPSMGSGIYLRSGSVTITISGSSVEERNTSCGNYKSGYIPSLDQQIRDVPGVFMKLIRTLTTSPFTVNKINDLG